MCGTVTAMQNRPEDIRRKGREHTWWLAGLTAFTLSCGWCMMYPLMHPGSSDLHALVPVMDRLCPPPTQLPLLQLLTLSW